MDAIRAAGLKLGVDPLGGAALPYWEPINAIYGLDIDGREPEGRSARSRFMTVDHDGKIRMDCSSPYAMASLVELKDQFRVAFANDPDSDRHGIVTPSAGLMNPEPLSGRGHPLSAHARPDWPANAAVGKTLVSSSMIDRVVRQAGPQAVRGAGRLQVVRAGPVRRLVSASAARKARAPVSCGATARVWTTDKDGPIMDLLAAEITARTGKDPGEHYRELTAQFGTPYYTRIDAAGDAGAEGAAAKAVARGGARRRELAGEPITAKLTRAPGNDAADRRPEGRDRERLVRRPAVGHGEHLQDLCRELQEPGASGRDRARGAEDR